MGRVARSGQQSRRRGLIHVQDSCLTCGTVHGYGLELRVLTCAGAVVEVVPFGSWPIDVKDLGDNSEALFEHVEEEAIMIGVLDKVNRWV